MSTLLRLVEDAVVSYLQAEDVGASVAPGISTEDKTLPIVICTAISETQDEAHSNMANSKVTVRVDVKGTGDAAQWDTICGKVRNALWVESEQLGEDIGGHGTDLLCWGAFGSRVIERTIEDDVWIETHNVSLYCAKVA